MFRVESVLHPDGYVFDTDRIDGRRINNLCAEVTELHRFNVREFVDGVGTLDNFRVSCHEAVHICPYLQYLGIQHGSDDRCRVVRATTTEICRLMTVTVTGNKARYNINSFVVEFLERFFHQLRGQIGINNVFTLFLLRTDKVTAVHANTVLHHCSYDMRTQSLTIRNDGILCLLRQVVNQVHTIVDTLQLIEELVYIIK